MTSRPTPPSAEERLAAIHRLCIEAVENYGHRSPMREHWLICIDSGREIYRLSSPTKRVKRGRKRA